MASLNKQIILRQALTGNQISININNDNFIDIIKEEISKINNINVYNLIINQDIYLCFEFFLIQYDDIIELQIIDIVFLSYKLVDIINLLDNDEYNQHKQDIINLLDNINLIIYLITQKYSIFKYLNDEFKNNFEFVKLAVQNNGYVLEYASDEFKNNFEIVKLAVQKFAYALQYASNELKNNFEIVSIAVKTNGYALQYASNKLKDNFEIVSIAVKNDKNALKYASRRIQLIL